QSLVYPLTHGECQFPPEEVQLLASRAPIYGVFILPSGPLSLPYLESLHRVRVIESRAISHGPRAHKAGRTMDQVQHDLDGGRRASASMVGRVVQRRPERRRGS